MDSKPTFISGFIELYRAHPCLWKIKGDEYSNRRLRDEAYDVLLEFYKKTVPSATVETVKKKINNLRSSFRKELKKVKNQKSGSSGDDEYKPALWYYEQLLFTLDQEETRATIGSDNPLPFDSPEEDALTALRSPSSPVANWSDSVSSGPLNSYRNTKKSSNEQKRKQAVDAALKALKEDDEFDGIGLNVACKLRRMSEEQKIYAEMLINKELMNSVKERLQEETDLCALKFTQPQTPVRQAERATPFSFGQDLSQTTNSNNLTTGEEDVRYTSRKYFRSDNVDSDNHLSEFLVLN